MDKTAVSDARINFQSLKDDPEAMLSLVNKYVHIQLIMNKSFCGFIHSIDPITCRLVLQSLFFPFTHKVQSYLTNFKVIFYERQGVLEGLLTVM